MNFPNTNFHAWSSSGGGFTSGINPARGEVRQRPLAPVRQTRNTDGQTRNDAHDQKEMLLFWQITAKSFMICQIVLI